MNNRLTPTDVWNIFGLDNIVEAIEEHIIPVLTPEKPNHQNGLHTDAQQLVIENQKALCEINTLKKEVQQVNNKNIELCKQLSNTVKQIESVIQANNRINNELNIVTQENNELKKAMGIVNKKNIALQQELINLVKDKHEYDIQVINDQISVNIQLVKNMFEEFVLTYIRKNTKKSSGCFGIFSPHGSDGRNAAIQFHHAFNLNIDTVNSKKELLTYLKMLKINNEIHLSGNYYPASFKTYLLAYYQYVDQFDMQKQCAPINVPTYVRQYVNNTPDIEKQYERVFCNNDVPILIRKRDII